MILSPFPLTALYSSASSDVAVRTIDGVFFNDCDRAYVFVEDIPPYTTNIIRDAIGHIYPMNVRHIRGDKWMLWGQLEGARFPVSFELRTTPDVFLSSLVL